MPLSPVVISLPIADRRTSHAFYRDVLGVDAFGELADDGVPEPLQFILNNGVRLMLVPSGGFGWVIGDHHVAERGYSECLLSLAEGDQAGVNELVAHAVRAGAEIVTDPGQQPWGYSGAFADPDGHVWMVAAESWPVVSNIDTVRATFAAYQAQDREAAERLLADSLVFTSPQDDHIDKTAYLERCFPTADRFVFREIVELTDVDGEEAFLMYEYELTTGERYRNAELITVRDGQVVEIQVFFGGRVH